MARQGFLLDLGKLARDNGTFVSATMFGALAACGTLPWPVEQSRAVLGDDRSRAGFDAAVKAVEAIKLGEAEIAPPEAQAVQGRGDLPQGLDEVLHNGAERCEDFQDRAYRDLFEERANALISAIGLNDHRAVHAVTEAVRRLALWMAYEDVARVADLKTRPERFAQIREEVRLAPGQTLRITEYMKPRTEEIADILPVWIGRRMMARAKRGGRFPLLGKGRYVRSNGVIGYRMLRLVAGLRLIRRRSLRYGEEQAAIEGWLAAMHKVLPANVDFAMGLGELPRVRKGYSDTLQRGLRAYDQLMTHIVSPAIAAGVRPDDAKQLRDAIGAALADDSHAKLDAVIAGKVLEPDIPMLRKVANA
jgi:indolepyruvate ferredoxin oxidoreductase beta subunit